MRESFILRNDKVPLTKTSPAASTAISTAVYLNRIPFFVKDELQRLYGHIHSSLPYIQAFYATEQVSTYVARHGGIPTAILLFRFGKRSIEVLNKTMQIDQSELRRFAAYMFGRFPSVDVISIEAVQTDLSHFPYPLQRGHAMENILLTPPATPEEYTSRLGKSTRSNLKYYRAKLEKSFAAVSFQSYEKEAINEQLVHDLIKLSEARITAKKINFSINSEFAKCLVDLTRVCGVVNVIWVDGQLCAGAISYRVGTDQYTKVIAHDPKYNAYSPGMLCFYLAICESIAKGVNRYHLGGGRYDYKIRLLGVQQDMEQVTLYRSERAMIMNGDRVIKIWLNARLLQLKTWLRKNETSLPVRILIESRCLIRKIMKNR